MSVQIKADVEIQGEFVNSLIREVNNAVYKNIDDVVEFVKWLDDELCFLVSIMLHTLKHYDFMIPSVSLFAHHSDVRTLL